MDNINDLPLKDVFIITHNVIDEKNKRKRTIEEKGKFEHYFEIYDDDENLYFKGYSIDNNSESAFIPLDTVGASYGCTDIKYLRESGEMESL